MGGCLVGKRVTEKGTALSSAAPDSMTRVTALRQEVDRDVAQLVGGGGGSALLRQV